VEDEKLEGEIKTLEIAVDAHTKDNRDKRKSLQERRNAVAKGMTLLTIDMQQASRLPTASSRASRPACS
jgi:hypothetical protein